MGSDFSMNNLNLILIIVIIAAILGLILFIFVVVKLYNIISKSKIEPSEEQSSDQQSVVQQRCIEGIQVQCGRSSNQEQDVEVAGICIEPQIQLNQQNKISENLSIVDKSQTTEIIHNQSIIQEREITNIEKIPFKSSNAIYPLQVLQIKIQ
ncbi:transmembrane protein, putative (macronuclear) [Tetrahymena thermophila SB210]|uniref:Transmembrane protein, putative n=1 Tax=Tetrahymena thermophila (strain SB210) TaxID=312017 RepID=W7XB93_TETTS|nr:transmembrane protein, putative [Tetrahymena thermophila SB210]EWS70946.1 transmembrane protein, putative [Tetrahymena thermophila SB210]|eukprot:XP_012656502.1 transmembrane protein, putative [Tetrahymena thermophila SB210]